MALPSKNNISTCGAITGNGSSVAPLCLNLEALPYVGASQNTRIIVSGGTGGWATPTEIVTAGIGGLQHGAQGVLGGSGPANTYIGADRLLHLLPPAPSGGGATTNTLGSSANTLTSTVNGTAANAPIINSNALGLTQSSGISSNVNGIEASIAIPSGTAARILAFDSAGNPVHDAVPSGGSGGTPTNSLTSASNIMTSVVGGGTPSQAAIVATNAIVLAQSVGLRSSVNGLSTTQAIPSGTAARILAFDSAGNPVHDAVPSGGSGGTPTNSLTSASNIMTSVVGGGTPAQTAIVATNAIVLSQSVGLRSSVNGLANTQAIPSGTAARMLAFDSAGNPVHDAVPSGGSGGTPTNSLTSASNIMTSVVGGGTPSQAAIVATNEISLTQAAGLKSKVNGLTSTFDIPMGSAARMLGFDSNGFLIHTSISSGGGSVSVADTQIPYGNSASVITSSPNMRYRYNNNSFEVGEGADSGGDHNVVLGSDSANPNVIAQTSHYSLIAGGRTNTIENNSVASGIICGRNNYAQGDWSVVIGGIGNSASNDSAAIIGGSNNQTDAMHSVVVGGFTNRTLAENSIVIGGQYNTTNGLNAVASGNRTNAQGRNQFVVGEFNIPQGNSTNEVYYDHAFIIGNGDIANNIQRNAYAVFKNGMVQMYPVFGALASYGTNTDAINFLNSIYSGGPIAFGALCCLNVNGVPSYFKTNGAQWFFAF